MTHSPFLLTLFEPCGKILLTAGFGFSLFKVIKSEASFENAILSGLIGFFSLWFYKDLFHGLEHIIDSLNKFLTVHSDQRSFHDHFLEAIQKAQISKPGLPDTSEMYSQLWKFGVWSVVTSITQLIFLVSDQVIIIASKVLSSQVLLFFPIGCGLFPIFPGILKNLALYAIELSLWRPMISIVQEITSLVTQDYLANDTTQGLQIIAVEIVAIYLIVNIPRTTHAVVSGALSGDHGSFSGALQTGHDSPGRAVKFFRRTNDYTSNSNARNGGQS